MTFKEFANWCNDRACDGQWGMAEAIACSETASAVYKYPFWKREKMWREIYKDNIMPIVEATENKRKEILGENYYEKI